MIGVNPERFPKINVSGGKAGADFLVAPTTQELIGEFEREKYGQPLFVADAGRSEDEVGANVDLGAAGSGSIPAWRTIRLA